MTKKEKSLEVGITWEDFYRLMGLAAKTPPFPNKPDSTSSQTSESHHDGDSGGTRRYRFSNQHINTKGRYTWGLRSKSVGDD